MALGTPVAAAIAYSTAGGTTVSPAYPSGILATDEVLLFVGQKPSTANGGTVSTPNNWTLRDSLTAAGGYGTTLGADTGNTNLFVYSWDTVTAGQTGNLSVTVGTNDICWAFMVRIPTGGSASYGTADGQRTTAPTTNVSFSVALTNGATATNFQSGDLAIWAMCVATDNTTPSGFSAQSITATGATFATAVELNEADSNLGNDVGGYAAYASVSSGSSTAAPTVSVTPSGTQTNVNNIRGPIVLLRVRDTSQVLTPSLYTNGQTFYGPTVTSSYALTPSRYDNAQTFYAATITQTGGTQTLTPSLFTNDQAFFAATAQATYNLAPSRYDNAQTFYAPAVTTSYTLTPALFTNAQTFYDPAVTTSYTLQPALYTNDQTFYGPVITQSGAPQTLLPDLYSNAQTFYSATISTTYELTPAKYDNTQTFYDPTVSASYSLQPSLVTNDQDFYSPTVAASYELTPSLVTNDQTFYAPAITASYELTPAKYDNTQTFYDPTVSQGTPAQTLEPELVSNTQDFFSPTATATYTLAPQGYVDDGYVDTGYIGPNTSSTQQFFSPTVTPGPVTLAAALFLNQGTFFAPTVGIGGDWVEQNERAYGKKRRRDYTAVQPEKEADWALQMQIKQEDEIVLAVVMAAAPILGDNTWRQ